MINFKATKVFDDTYKAVNNKLNGKTTYKIIVQEGSSRSSKTWSNFQVLFMFAYSYHYKSALVLRDVATDCHDILEKEWIEWITDPMGRMKQSEKGLIDIAEALKLMQSEDLSKFFIRNKQKHTWTCIKTNSVIRFSGLDSDTKVMGMTNDIVWINEPYSFNEEVFKQLLQRSKQILFDWNPRQKHFIQKYKARTDAITLHSTFLDNPFCPEEHERQLLSYQSIKFSQVVLSGLIEEQRAKIYDFESNPLFFTNTQIKELKRCIYNEETESASDYHWQVYGLGIGAERPNRILKAKPIKYSDYLLINKPIWYGVDWGKVDPFGIVEIKYDDGRLFVNELNYRSENEISNSLTDTQKHQIKAQHEEGLVLWLFNTLGIDKSRPIICDNNRPEKVLALRKAGYDNAVTADKEQGSILDGIDLLTKLEIYYTSNSKNFEHEQENYSYKVDRKGEQLEEPEDTNNHLIDPTRYVAMKLKKLGIIKII